MTQVGNKMRNKDLAMIHIAKKKIGMDDETYRSMLWTCARVKSSADLDYAGRAKVLAHLASRGWKKPTAPNVTQLKKPLISKIGALLADMKLPWAYAEGIAKQMYKRTKLEWCNTDELRSIVAALVKKQKAGNGQN